jgi:hypothetical protein
VTLWRKNARHDTNHAQIVGVLRAHGCSVQAMNAAGAPDLLVGLRGENHLVEVKRPLGVKGGASGRELNPIQRAWHAAWKGDKPWTLRSEMEAVEWVKARIDDAKGPL